MRTRQGEHDESSATVNGVGSESDRERQPSHLAAIHRSLGNQAVSRLADGEGSAPVSDPDGPAEREAERVARAVVRTGEHSPQQVQAETSSRAPNPTEDPRAGAGVGAREEDGRSAVERPLKRPGRPLGSETRSRFEDILGADLGSVRIHTDSAADDAARALDARAFTYGPDIAFAAGQYAPGTKQGTELIAHELMHVVQQRGPSTAPVIQRGGDGSAGQSVDRGREGSGSREASSSTVVGTQLQPAGGSSAGGRQPAAAHRPEISDGLRRLQQHTVGETLLALREWNRAESDEPTRVVASARRSNFPLRSVVQNVVYLSNRAYLLDPSGNVVRGGHRYPLGGTTFDPGGVYFSGYYHFGEYTGDDEIQPKGTQFASFRLDGDVSVEGGDFHLENIFQQMTEFKPRLDRVSSGTAGLGVIVSSAVGKEGPPIDLTKVVDALKRSTAYLEWAARERVERAVENPTDELVDGVVDLGMDTVLENLGRVSPIVGQVVMAYELSEITGWLGDVANVAAHARTQSELEIAAQQIARRVIDEAWDELRSRGLSKATAGGSGGSSRRQGSESTGRETASEREAPAGPGRTSESRSSAGGEGTERPPSARSIIEGERESTPRPEGTGRDQGEMDTPESSVSSTEDMARQLGEELDIWSQAGEGADASRVGDRVQSAVDDAIDAGLVSGPASPGTVDLAIQPHRRRTDVRNAYDVSGYDYESAHFNPTAALKHLAGYSREGAKTTLLPKSVHREFDKHWKDWAREQSGEEVTVREWLQVMDQAIMQVDSLEPRVKRAFSAYFRHELLIELRLSLDDSVGIPQM